MIKIIMMGHGQIATGFLSALHLIAGHSEGVVALDFTADMTAEDVKTRLCDSIGASQEVLILCDLLGGTPFKTAATLMQELPDKQINVLTGLNLAMLIDLVFARLSCQDMTELTAQGLSSAKNGIVDAKTLFTSDETKIEDGI